METTLDPAALERAHHYFKDSKKYIDFNDLRLLLAPADLSGALLVAARHDQKPTLILCHPPNGDRRDICELALWASAREYSWLEELCSDPLFQDDFILLLNSRKETCEFRASRNVNSSEANMDRLVSRLLSCLLITGRPLRYYGCTFFLPLDLQLDEDLQEKGEAFKQLIESLVESPDVEHHQINPSKKISRFSPDESEVQAYLYFLPLLRDFIVDTQDSISKTVAIKPIQHWRLRPATIQKMSLQLGSPYASAKQNFPNLIAKICDVSLYRYYNDLLLFALRIELNEVLPKGSSLLENDDTWWHDLLDFSNNQDRLMGSDLQSLQIETWLRFTKLARILYPSFIEQVAEEKIDYVTLLHTQHQPIVFSAADKFSPLLINLLNYFFSTKGAEKELIRRLNHIPEDRMFVNVAYGLAGPTPEDSRAQACFERLFSLALYVDQGSDGCDSQDGYAYDREFTRDLMKQQVLYRWKGLGTLSGYTCYSNVYMGYGSFFKDVIAPSHVPYIYGRMLTLALFYQLTLRYFNRRVTFATQKLVELKGYQLPESFSELRRDFIEFTNNYWFREITSQIQGIEVFSRQTKELGLEQEYALIKDEMERADEYVETLRERRFNHRADRFSYIAGLLAIAAVVSSLFAVPDIGKFGFPAIIPLIITMVAFIGVLFIFLKSDK